MNVLFVLLLSLCYHTFILLSIHKFKIFTIIFLPQKHKQMFDFSNWIFQSRLNQTFVRLLGKMLYFLRKTYVRVVGRTKNQTSVRVFQFGYKLIHPQTNSKIFTLPYFYFKSQNPYQNQAFSQFPFKNHLSQLISKNSLFS